MSRSLVEYQRTPSRKLAQSLNASSRQQQQGRTLQRQGNESLGLGVLEGYFTISIPTTIEPSVASVNVVAPTGTTILIGNLMYSIYYRYNVGGASPTGYVFDNRDSGNLYPTRLSWECFLAYDARDKGSGLLGTLDDVVNAGVEHDTARITARISSNSSWSIPSGSDTVAYVFYQIRATMM